MTILCAIQFTVFMFQDIDTIPGQAPRDLVVINGPPYIAPSTTQYHPDIIIDGNSELSSFPDKTGSGTAGDPYVIQGYYFYQDIGAYTHDAVDIRNTDDYLVIYNCKFILGTVAGGLSQDGISFYNVSNAFVIDCVFDDSYPSGYVTINHCNGITVNGSTFTGGHVDIDVSYSSHVTIGENIFVDTDRAINAVNVDNASILSNTVYNDGGLLNSHLIYLNGFDDGEVSWNTINSSETHNGALYLSGWNNDVLNNNVTVYDGTAATISGLNTLEGNNFVVVNQEDPPEDPPDDPPVDPIDYPDTTPSTYERDLIVLVGTIAAFGAILAIVASMAVRDAIANRESRKSRAVTKRGHLDLSNSGITKLRDTFKYMKIGKLKSLDLSANAIHHVNYLKRFPGLQALDLGSNRIRNVSALGHLKNLETLYLDNNDIQAIKNLDGLENLKVLSLAHNTLRAFKGIPCNVEKLGLSGNPLASLDGLERLTNLKALCIEDVGLPRTLVEELGGADDEGWCNEPARFVEYAQRNLELGDRVDD